MVHAGYAENGRHQGSGEKQRIEHQHVRLEVAAHGQELVDHNRRADLAEEAGQEVPLDTGRSQSVAGDTSGAAAQGVEPFTEGRAGAAERQSPSRYGRLRVGPRREGDGVALRRERFGEGE